MESMKIEDATGVQAGGTWVHGRVRVVELVAGILNPFGDLTLAVAVRTSGPHLPDEPREVVIPINQVTGVRFGDWS